MWQSGEVRRNKWQQDHLQRTLTLTYRTISISQVLWDSRRLMPACFFSALPACPNHPLTHAHTSATPGSASAHPSLADLGSLESIAWQPFSCCSLSWKRRQLWAMDTCSHLSVLPPQPALFEHFCPIALETGLLQGWTGVESTV